MKRITEYNKEELVIIQPSIFKRVYELKSADNVIARLLYPRFFSTNATVEGFQERWEFKKMSIWNSNVQILREKNHYPYAKLLIDFWKSKGVIELPKGVKLNCKFGLLKNAAEVFSPKGDLLLHIINKLSFKEKLWVIIKKPTDLLDENPWIIFLCIYIFLQKKRRAS
jgi:hypothetical protein